jgi:hypothetical protein
LIKASLCVWMHVDDWASQFGCVRLPKLNRLPPVGVTEFVRRYNSAGSQGDGSDAPLPCELYIEPGGIHACAILDVINHARVDAHMRRTAAFLAARIKA